MATRKRLPEWIAEMIRDWVLGECAAVGRDRSSLLAVMEQIARLGGTPVGQAKLAREAGLANNTVAAGYLEMLADLMCVGVCLPIDTSRRVRLRRKPAKYPFINLLAASAWSPRRPRTVSEWRALPAQVRGVATEWAVAQEIWRRAAIAGDPTPEDLSFWRSREHEIDFVTPSGFVEVKLGRAGPLDFTWFPRIFPGEALTVVTSHPFETDAVSTLR